MKVLFAVALMALAFAVPASSTDNIKSGNISGVIPVTIYANGLTPGASYTARFETFQSDTDTNPYVYFRSSVTADANGNVVVSAPLQILDDYGAWDPYVIEMTLEQPDANGWLVPVYDANGHEYCTRVDVWEYSAQDNCTSS